MREREEEWRGYINNKTLANVYLHSYCRRVGSQSAKQWLDRLQRENVPVLVCLTFADKFYAEYMSEDGQYPTKAEMEFRLQDQLTVS